MTSCTTSTSQRTSPSARYDKVKGVLPERVTFGVDHPTEAIERRVTNPSAAGLHRGDVLVISSRRSSTGGCGCAGCGRVTIVNPVAEQFTTLRTHLLPDLLAYLGRNTHHEYPQSVYELGEVVGEGARNHMRAAAAHVHAKAGFTLAKSLAEEWGATSGSPRGHGIEAEEHPSFIPAGARASWSGKGGGPFRRGPPEVLEAFGISQPTIAMELDLEAIGGRLPSGSVS